MVLLPHCQIYGKKLCIFPLKWREWWLECISQFDEFNEVSLISPDIVVKNITNNKVEFDTLVNSGKLGDLELPTLLCLWSCNEYIHKSEHFPIDLIFQQYFRRIALVKIFKKR